MSIRQLSLNNFRNLLPATLNFHQNINIIYGDNASGKTSLLEALHVICQGNSFKSKTMDLCIQHRKDDFLIFSQFNNYKAGISRFKKKSNIRVDGETIHRLSDLAILTPVRIINNDSFNLVSGQPGLKRDYMDWYLFHVEHGFQKIRSEYFYALKQRNMILKTKKNIKQVYYWEKYLIDNASIIRKTRKGYVDNILKIIQSELNSLTNDLNLFIDYKVGWNELKNLDDVFDEQRQKDIYLGYTRYGIHRDDLILKSDNHEVKDILSRGQLKRLSVALVIAQIIHLRKNSNKSIIVLIDDISSELDFQSLQTVLIILERLDVQVFITSINAIKNPFSKDKEYKMFHVEHGMIKTVKS